jgi:hypothetical protein
MNKNIKGYILLVMVVAGSLLSYSSNAQIKIGDNLGTHKATRALDMSSKNIDNVGSVLYTASPITLGTSTAIGANTATVDVFSSFAITASAGSLTFTLPTPTATTAGRIVYVINAGATNAFTMYGINIGVGQYASFVFNGTNWVPAAVATTGVALSSITAATTTNLIDNLNFSQTWRWSTATTQTPFSLEANALTTGNLLDLKANALTSGSVLSVTSNSAVKTGTNGLLYVANLNAATTGTVATIQANSTAGSGLSVLANGNVGIGTNAPKATLHNDGSTIIGGVATITNLTTGGNIGASAAATVDAKSVFAVAQTTAAQTLTLFTPTDATAGRVATVINTGTASFTLGGSTVAPGTAQTMIWNGSAWVSNAGGSVSGKQTITVAGANAGLSTATLNDGSSNVIFTVTLTVAGVQADDAITVNYAQSDYTTSGWLAPGTSGVGQNEGVTILSAVASAANTIKVTFANLIAGSQPSVDGLKLVVGYRR